jgi:hypothetical protein
MTESKRDLRGLAEALKDSFPVQMEQRRQEQAGEFLRQVASIDPVKTAAYLQAVTEYEKMSSETKTTTTTTPYLDQPGRLTINWEGSTKKMKELEWIVDGLRARCMDCQTNKNKAAKRIDNLCVSCLTTLWNCAEWRRDEDQGGESINKYFKEHPIPDPFAGVTSWMKQYYERCLERLVKEKAADMKEPAWKDITTIRKVKAILNTPDPVTAAKSTPAAPATWEFSEGCEGRCGWS